MQSISMSSEEFQGNKKVIAQRVSISDVATRTAHVPDCEQCRNNRQVTNAAKKRTEIGTTGLHGENRRNISAMQDPRTMIPTRVRRIAVRSTRYTQRRATHENKLSTTEALEARKIVHCKEALITKLKPWNQWIDETWWPLPRLENYSTQNILQDGNRMQSVESANKTHVL